MIVDTNALSAFAEGSQAVREALASGPGPYLPVVVIGEYRFGLMAARDRHRRLAWLEELLRGQPMVWVVFFVHSPAGCRRSRSAPGNGPSEQARTVRPEIRPTTEARSVNREAGWVLSKPKAPLWTAPTCSTGRSNWG